MRLSDEQNNFLRMLGHSLTPVCEVGAGGLTNSILRTIDRALETEELVKVLVPFGTEQKRSKVLNELVPLAQTWVVQRTGSYALLYRPASDPKIELPDAPAA
jgi:RNA-binding protein